MADSKQNILLQAKLLFAQQGYSSISMRQLAKAVGISPATLYHHFPDKESLYLETVKFAFAIQENAFTEVWDSSHNAAEKLRLFIHCFVDLMLQDRNFHRLMQRELLDDNPERMKLLADKVFQQQFSRIMAILQELSPTMDAHLGAVSVIGLVCQQLQMQPIKKFLPGCKTQHDEASTIASHIVELLSNPLTGKTR